MLSLLFVRFPLSMCLTMHTLCDICGNDKHSTAFHVDSNPPSSEFNFNSATQHGGESRYPIETSSAVNVKKMCTQICKGKINVKTCFNTILVREFRQDSPDEFLALYVIVDDQSNRYLASLHFLEFFGVRNRYTEYTLYGQSSHFR